MSGNPFDHARGGVFAIRFEDGVQEFRAGSAGSDARTIRAPGNPLACVLRQSFDWERGAIGQNLRFAAMYAGMSKYTKIPSKAN